MRISKNTILLKWDDNQCTVKAKRKRHQKWKNKQTNKTLFCLEIVFCKHPSAKPMIPVIWIVFICIGYQMLLFHLFTLLLLYNLWLIYSFSLSCSPSFRKKKSVWKRAIKSQSSCMFCSTTRTWLTWENWHLFSSSFKRLY